MATEEEVQEEVWRIARIVGAKYDQLPTVCGLQGDRPNIEIADDGTFSYEVYERDLQIFCYTFTDLEELMFHTFNDIAPKKAKEYATEMEAHGKDYFKSLLNKKIELMGNVKAEWAERMEAAQRGD